MESSEARTFARFGGVLLLVSLLLPTFAIPIAGIDSIDFHLWRLDKTAFLIIGGFALFVLAQIPFSSRDSVALIYLITGAIFTAALIYKIWIAPPGDAPIGELLNKLGGLGDSGSFSVNGKPVDSITVNEVLKAFGLKLKPSYGAYMAFVGSCFVTAGAYIEFRKAGQASEVAQATPQPQQVPAGQRYQPPTPQAYAADPFAAAAQQPVAQQPAAAPVVPPDPFARPPQPPTV